MATFEERLAAVELLLGVTAGEKVYNSVYSGEQIDEAVARALPGGALDTGKAPAGYGLGTKQDGVKDSFYRSGGAIGWYRVATARSISASAIVSINHVWASGGSSDLVLLVSIMGGVKCLTGDGANSSNQAIISNARLVKLTNDTYALDVYCRAAVYNPWSINIINTGTNNADLAEPSFTIQTPTFVATNGTLPEGETLLFPMEWLNPPMLLGVEYRTTKRYMGKPVYAKLVNFGALPNASNKSVAHNLSNPLMMVDGKITDSNGSFVTNYNIKNFAISTANMIVETETDMSGVSAYILLKYTKTTD